MDDSLKGFSSSSSMPLKPSANPRISNTESKEGDENDQKTSKNQNQKKPPHFMSPTISAISKKKILTERNESLDSSEPHQLNTTSNPVPEASPINPLNSSSRTFSQKTASEVRFHKSEDDDSASKPYDPLTNYLSPRPKFLRYKPKKRGDMLTRRESETEKEVEGSDEQSSTERSSSPKSSDEIENDEDNALNKNDDHSFEDDDEEIRDFEIEGGLSWRGGFKFVLVAAVLSLLTWYISCMNSSEPSPAVNLIRRSTDRYLNGYNRMYDFVDDVSDNGQDLVQSINVTEDDGESEEAGNVNDQNFGVEMDGHDEQQPRGTEITESEEKHKPFQEEQLLPTSVSDSVDTDVSDYHEMEAVLEGGSDDHHEKGIETAAAEDKSESFEDYQTSPTSDLGNKYVSEIEKTEGEEIETSVEGEDSKIEEKSLIELFGTKYSKNNLIYGVFVALFMIIASSVLALYSKYKKAPIQKSQLTKRKPAENIRSNYPFAPNLENAHMKKVESYARPSPYFSSVEENSNDLLVTHAPEVELLGEFVVGDVWSSMKNFSMTSKTKELEVKFSDVEFQGETSAVFQDKVVYSRPQLSTPEYSASTTAADSPSYGSVTDKKKRVKKEEGSATTTPVRRSSRLRNRVMSP